MINFSNYTIDTPQVKCHAFFQLSCKEVPFYRCSTLIDAPHFINDPHLQDVISAHCQDMLFQGRQHLDCIDTVNEKNITNLCCAQLLNLKYS